MLGQLTTVVYERKKERLPRRGCKPLLIQASVRSEAHTNPQDHGALAGTTKIKGEITERYFYLTLSIYLSTTCPWFTYSELFKAEILCDGFKLLLLFLECK